MAPADQTRPCRPPAAIVCLYESAPPRLPAGACAGGIGPGAAPERAEGPTTAPMSVLFPVTAEPVSEPA
jgi:hypothetical protein